QAGDLDGSGYGHVPSVGSDYRRLPADGGRGDRTNSLTVVLDRSCVAVHVVLAGQCLDGDPDGLGDLAPYPGGPLVLGPAGEVQRSPVIHRDRLAPPAL